MRGMDSLVLGNNSWGLFVILWGHGWICRRERSREAAVGDSKRSGRGSGLRKNGKNDESPVEISFWMGMAAGAAGQAALDCEQQDTVQATAKEEEQDIF